VLRVCLDKPADAESEYVSIDDCEKVNVWLSDTLDKNDIIERSYNLEVSSAGLDRELLKDSDYVRFAGRAVEVKTYEQINVSKSHEGILAGKENGVVTIDTGAGELAIPADKIAKINLAVVF
jgi:ribosome maturation factor RimP